MAIDYFISYTQQQKLALLKGITETLLTGQVTRVQTSPGVFTEFNPNISNELTYQRLCDSIASSPDYDENDPDQKAAAGNQKVGITRARFC